MATDAVRRILVVGVGRPGRGDESAGLLVAQAVRARWPEAVRVFEHSGEGASLLQIWSPWDGVFLFAPVASGRAPGTLYRFEATHEPVPRHFFHAMDHVFGVAEAIEAARDIGRLPGRLVVYGIEGRDFGDGDQLSPPVRHALRDLMERAFAEIRSLGERALAGKAEREMEGQRQG